MKIRTGRLVDGEHVSTYAIKIWTASRWVLTNTSLERTLVDKAYESAGIKPGPRYKDKMMAYGGGGADPSKEWNFEVTIIRMKWEEVTE
jgi:hypothetical protein